LRIQWISKGYFALGADSYLLKKAYRGGQVDKDIRKRLKIGNYQLQTKNKKQIQT
jgi:hypothetical protein